MGHRDRDPEQPKGTEEQAGERVPMPRGKMEGAPRRRFLVGGAAAAWAGLWACRRAGDTSARKGEPTPGPLPGDPPGEARTRLLAEGRREGPPPEVAPPRSGEGHKDGVGDSGGKGTSARQGKSRVAQVINSKAYGPKGAPEGKPVKAMVDLAVMTLTGKGTPEAAWKSLFSPKDRVGLKPNCLGRELCWPHPATVDAIVEGLVLAGVTHGNMVMWDMWGFEASPLSTRYRKSAMQVKPIKAWGFERKGHSIPSGGPVKLTKALRGLDAVVNIPVIKDHDLAGVTCALKNMAFGSIPTPWTFHSNRSGERLCDPMVPEIYALGPIKDRVRLILVDAFNIIIDGGPKGNIRGLRKIHSVFAATDPVAMDRIAWKIIDDHREQAKLRKLDDESRKVGRPRHVLTAERLGLGTADLDRIEHLVKTLG